MNDQNPAARTPDLASAAELKIASSLKIVCPTCHVIETELVFPAATGPAKTWPVVRCRPCGIVFMARLPDLPPNDGPSNEGPPSDASDAGHEQESQNRFGGPVEWVIRQFRMARVRKARRLMPAGGSTLDVGCGRAQYLKLLQDRGYDVRGTEYSSVTAARATPGVPVDAGEMTPGRFPDGSFDLISIWHVLEHVPRPDVVLEASAQALKSGGALMIAVPNFGSIQSAIGGEGWLHLDVPRHLFQFTKTSLRRLLEDQGFVVESIKTGQWEMDPFGLLQSALNRLGFRHNALFDTLRSDPALKHDLSRPYQLGMLLVGGLGAPFAALGSLVFRLIGRAGTLIVVARAP